MMMVMVRWGLDMRIRLPSSALETRIKFIFFIHIGLHPEADPEGPVQFGYFGHPPCNEEINLRY